MKNQTLFVSIGNFSRILNADSEAWAQSYSTSHLVWTSEVICRRLFFWEMHPIETFPKRKNTCMEIGTQTVLLAFRWTSVSLVLHHKEPEPQAKTHRVLLLADHYKKSFGDLSTKFWGPGPHQGGTCDPENVFTSKFCAGSAFFFFRACKRFSKEERVVPSPPEGFSPRPQSTIRQSCTSGHESPVHSVGVVCSQTAFPRVLTNAKANSSV